MTRSATATARATGEGIGGATREEILRAALEAFTERGFDGASTREIAAGAGVNHGLIPYYFGCKRKLWQAAVDLAFADMSEGLGALLADPTLTSDRSRMAALVRSYVHFLAQHPEFVRLMHDEGKRRGPRMRWLVDRHVKPVYDAVFALFERAQADRTLRADLPPLHLFYILAGAAGVIFHQAEECKRVSGVNPFDPAVVEEHARVVEALLLGPPIDGSPE